MHCAAIYGDVESIRALVATGKVDVNHQIDTVRGEMTPLDVGENTRAFHRKLHSYILKVLDIKEVVEPTHVLSQA